LQTKVTKPRHIQPLRPTETTQNNYKIKETKLTPVQSPLTNSGWETECLLQPQTHAW